MPRRLAEQRRRARVLTCRRARRHRTCHDAPGNPIALRPAAFGTLWRREQRVGQWISHSHHVDQDTTVMGFDAKFPPKLYRPWAAYSSWSLTELPGEWLLLERPPLRLRGIRFASALRTGIVRASTTIQPKERQHYEASRGFHRNRKIRHHSRRDVGQGRTVHRRHTRRHHLAARQPPYRRAQRPRHGGPGRRRRRDLRAGRGQYPRGRPNRTARLGNGQGRHRCGAAVDRREREHEGQGRALRRCCTAQVAARRQGADLATAPQAKLE